MSDVEDAESADYERVRREFAARCSSGEIHGEGCYLSTDGTVTDAGFHEPILGTEPPDGEVEAAIKRAMKAYGFSLEEAEALYRP